MIAQALLSLLLASVLVYAFVEYRRSPVVALLSCAAALAGLYFVWVPSHTTRVAEFVGVGRGVDLILYVWVCISLIVLLNMHLKLRTQHELITQLARTIALAKAGPADAVPAVSEALAPRLQPVADGHKSRHMQDQTA